MMLPGIITIGTPILITVLPMLMGMDNQAIAEMLGGYGEYVTDPNDISKVLKKAFKSNKPVVVNVKTSVYVCVA